MTLQHVVLASESTIPPDLFAVLSWGVLGASLLITAAWLAYVYR